MAFDAILCQNLNQFMRTYNSGFGHIIQVLTAISACHVAYNPVPRLHFTLPTTSSLEYKTTRHSALACKLTML